MRLKEDLKKSVTNSAELLRRTTKFGTVHAKMMHTQYM